MTLVTHEKLMTQIQQISEADQPRWQALFSAYGNFYNVSLSADTIKTTWGEQKL